MNFHLSGAHKFGLTLATLVLILTNYPSISNFVGSYNSPQPFSIPLCNVNNQVRIDVAQKEYANYTNVVDYSAKIYLDHGNVSFVGNQANLNVRVQDTGILSLQSPYFYILVFGPSNTLRFVFPCFIQQNNATINQYASGISYSLSGKWPPWTSPSAIINGQSLVCIDKETFYFVPNNCISRTSLMKGNLDIGQPISYTFPVRDPGVWQVYVFLFGTTYQTRPNTQAPPQNPPSPYQPSTPYDSQNAVASTVSNFYASSGTPPAPHTISFEQIVSQLASIVVAGTTYFAAGSSRVYPRIRAFWTKSRDWTKNLVLFLILVTVYTALLFYYFLH